LGRFVLTGERKAIEKRVINVIDRQTAEWEFSANVVLRHFRLILGAFLPFELGRKSLSELQSQANLDDKAIAYVKNVLDAWDNTCELVKYIYFDGKLIAYPDPNSSAETKEEREIADGRWIRQLFREVYT
jgi:hypothetical protein